MVAISLLLTAASAHAQTAVCGDAQLGGAEECDDGNTQSGDGCSAYCYLENPSGCRDGAREGFANMTDYPRIASCSGGWSVPGVRSAERTCATAGDDSDNPTGTGCSAIDLCAVGWHVCGSVTDVNNALGSNSCEDAADTSIPEDPSRFYVTQVSGPGFAQCGNSITETNDLFGCGSMGPAPGSNCGKLDRFSTDRCGGLSATDWDCDDGTGHTEQTVVYKPTALSGGVMCCFGTGATATILNPRYEISTRPQVYGIARLPNGSNVPDGTQVSVTFPEGRSLNVLTTAGAWSTQWHPDEADLTSTPVTVKAFVFDPVTGFSGSSAQLSLGDTDGDGVADADDGCRYDPEHTADNQSPCGCSGWLRASANAVAATDAGWGLATSFNSAYNQDPNLSDWYDGAGPTRAISVANVDFEVATKYGAIGPSGRQHALSIVSDANAADAQIALPASAFPVAMHLLITSKGNGIQCGRARQARIEYTDGSTGSFLLPTPEATANCADVAVRFGNDNVYYRKVLLPSPNGQHKRATRVYFPDDEDSSPVYVFALTLDVLDYGSDVEEADLDGDGVNACEEPNCDGDPTNDEDADGLCAPSDMCPFDTSKIDPEQCGCGQAELDYDSDGTSDCVDGCPDNPAKTDPGVCGCDAPLADSSLDSDGDGALDCVDFCPSDPNKVEAGVCGCGVRDVDSDGDSFVDCVDECPTDPFKHAPGVCGCGISEADSDADQTPDCVDPCTYDPNKVQPGVCGCNVPDVDRDGDTALDCADACADDPNKIDPGICGCGVSDAIDADGDATPDCIDGCPLDPNKANPGVCGCGVSDRDRDGDTYADCIDGCVADPNKIESGTCGCGISDADDDGDGTANCVDQCPQDNTKGQEGVCGCGSPDSDEDENGKIDCIEGFEWWQCGDGASEGPEECDDGNLTTGDGCDGSCVVEPGFACDTQQSATIENGGFETASRTILDTTEIDGWQVTRGAVDLLVNDGASASIVTCASGRVCIDLNGARRGEISQDVATVVNRWYVLTFRYASQCSDQNCERSVYVGARVPGGPMYQSAWYAASAQANGVAEPTYQRARFVFRARSERTRVTFSGDDQSNAGVILDDVRIPETLCVPENCGDGRIQAGEECDDGNTVDMDGCDAACMLAAGWDCSLRGGVPCTPACGDGIKVAHGEEECDDGNFYDGDGCSSDCRIDEGAACWASDGFAPTSACCFAAAEEETCLSDDALGCEQGRIDCDRPPACEAFAADSDGDSFCDAGDLCQGDDRSEDIDQDGICEAIDVCVGDDTDGDSDFDGRCDDLDEDDDNDGVCDFAFAVEGVCVAGPDEDTIDAGSDTDGDGLSDGLETSSVDTDPLDADTDDDGLTDGQEFFGSGPLTQFGPADPLNPDTDGDGLQDGLEAGVSGDDVGPDTDPMVFRGDADPETATSPLQADTDGGGFDDGSEDENGNGRFNLDEGETDPLDANDDVEPLLDGDCDADGLTDLEEAALGTQRCDADTDNGGKRDDLELQQGRDPLDGSDDFDEKNPASCAAAPGSSSGGHGGLSFFLLAALAVLVRRSRRTDMNRAQLARATAAGVARALTMLALALSLPASGCDSNVVDAVDPSKLGLPELDLDLAKKEIIVTPSSGSADGGTVVTITGQGFRTDAKVYFGSQQARDVTFVDESQLRAVSAPSTPGPVSVIVAHGTKVHAVAKDAFTYTQSTGIQVAAVRPARGPKEGGTEITIVGRGFGPDTSVQIGDQAAEVRVLNDQVLKVVTPAGDEGTVRVRVTRSGSSPFEVERGFTYFTPSFAVAALEPTSGPAEGGTPIFVRGEGFTPSTRVYFGNVEVTAVFAGEGVLQVTSPALVGGHHDVRLVDPSRPEIVAEDAFEAIPRPHLEILRVTPLVGGEGTAVTLSGYGFSEQTIVKFGGTPALAVEIKGPTTIVAIVPATDDLVMTDITIEREDGELFLLEDRFEWLPGAADDSDGPYVAGATAADPYTIRLRFSEPVRPAAATDPVNFQISVVGSSVGRLHVVSAEQDPTDLASVIIHTLPQADVDYRITVSGVVDFSGNAIRPQGVLTAYSQTDLRGLSEALFRHDVAALRALRTWQVDPTCDSVAGAEWLGTDTDCDSMLDRHEQVGSTIYVTDVNGNVSEREVASSPFSRDTDGDTIEDPIEASLFTDPQSVDTDSDLINDDVEWLEWRSDPTNADTDGDGINEPSEERNNTSPLLADTDGDLYDDYQELTTEGRRPRIADVPEWDISVTRADFALDVRYTTTDSRGQEVSTTEAVETSLQSSNERSVTDSRSSTTSNTRDMGFQVGAKVGFGAEKEIGLPPKVKINASAEISGGFNMAWSNTSESTLATDSSTSSQATQALNQSFDRSNAFSTSSEVSREVVGASISVGVTFAALSNVAFTIRNVEVTAMIRDRDAPGHSGYRPIATLVPASSLLDGRDFEVNLGPLTPRRGPIVFTNRDIFPSQVEEMMKNPEAVVFKVTNFDILDEDERNWAFISQAIAERSSTILLDFGDGTSRVENVATTSHFDRQTGRMVGLSISQLIEAMGYYPWSAKHPAGEEQYPPGDQPLFFLGNSRPTGRVEGCTAPNVLDCDELKESFGFGYTTVDRNRDGSPDVDGAGREILVRMPSRIGTVAASFESDGKTLARGGRYWAVFTNDLQLAPEDDFDTGRARPGRAYTIAFTKDSDDDGVFDIIERSHKSIDTTVDSDGDGLTDFAEIYGMKKYFKKDGTDESWLVQTFLDADRQQQDRGYAVRSSPAKLDTDEDGLFDRQEQALGTDPRSSDTDNDGIKDFDEYTGFLVDLFYDEVEPPPGVTCPVFVGHAGLAARATTQPVWLTDVAAGRWSSSESSVWIRGCLAMKTDPLVRDSDGDGYSDGLERRAGTNPTEDDSSRFSDTDRDGLFDAVETIGWRPSPSCEGATTITSTKSVNGLVVPATYAARYCSYCRSLDAAGMLKPNTSPTCKAETLASSVPTLQDTDGDGLDDLIERALGTDPRATDTDRDGLTDFAEWDHQSYPLDDPNPAALQALKAECAEAVACVWREADSQRIGTNPADGDTDGDFVSDGDELRGWTIQLSTSTITTTQLVTSDPFSPDSDGDGLNDGLERMVLTNPQVTDTDGDLLSDFAEYNNPLRNPATGEVEITVSFVGFAGATADFVTGKAADMQVRFMSIDESKWHTLVPRGAIAERHPSMQVHAGLGGKCFNDAATITYDGNPNKPFGLHVTVPLDDTIAFDAEFFQFGHLCNYFRHTVDQGGTRVSGNKAAYVSGLTNDQLQVKIKDVVARGGITLPLQIMGTTSGQLGTATVSVTLGHSSNVEPPPISLYYSTERGFDTQHCVNMLSGDAAYDIDKSFIDNFLCSSEDVGLTYSRTNNVAGKNCVEVVEGSYSRYVCWNNTFDLDIGYSLDGYNPRSTTYTRGNFAACVNAGQTENYLQRYLWTWNPPSGSPFEGSTVRIWYWSWFSWYYKDVVLQSPYRPQSGYLPWSADRLTVAIHDVDNAWVNNTLCYKKVYPRAIGSSKALPPSTPAALSVWPTTPAAWVPTDPAVASCRPTTADPRAGERPWYGLAAGQKLAQLDCSPGPEARVLLTPDGTHNGRAYFYASLAASFGGGCELQWNGVAGSLGAVTSASYTVSSDQYVAEANCGGRGDRVWLEGEPSRFKVHTNIDGRDCKLSVLGSSGFNTDTAQHIAPDSRAMVFDCSASAAGDWFTTGL